MKLDSVVGAEPELQAHSSSSSLQVSEDVSSSNSNKRLKLSKVNGFIVYSRLRKSNSSNSSSSGLKRFTKISSFGDRSRTCFENGVNNSLEEASVKETVNKKCLKDEAVVRDGALYERVNTDTLTVENGTGESGIWNDNEDICEDKIRVSPTLDTDSLDVPIAVLCSEVRRKKSKRCVQSTVKKLQGETVEVLVNGLEAIDSQAISTVHVETISEESALMPPKKNMELKMSKKIALGTIPMTVKELFETGLLEGVPVVYMGGKKFQAFGLRGMIKGVGILCSCCLCNGCRVIPPSQFEIHAINQYRRASQYICFENGKSLLDVLNICRTSSLESLEATICSAIRGLPKERTFTCKRCKGTFPTICVGKVGPLCYTCTESKQSHGNPTCGAILNASLTKPVLTLESSKTAPLSTKIQENGLPTAEKISIKAELETSSHKNAPVTMSSRSFELDSISKSSVKLSVDMSSPKGKARKNTSRKSKLGRISKSSKSMQGGISSQKYQWRVTPKLVPDSRRDQQLHRLVFEEGGLPDGTELAYYARGQKLLIGYKRGSGIFCCCCSSEVSPSTFEAHAGWTTRKKPYAYIYSSNGISLHELALSLSKGHWHSAKDSDDICVICSDGGDLVLCDGCPRAFHAGCASLSSIPDGDWYCQFCQNIFQPGEFPKFNVESIGAGSFGGVVPVEQTTKRCTRIAKSIETDLSGCMLCRGYDFTRNGFGPRTIVLCDQCEREFHVGCLRSHRIATMKEVPKGKWFCCPDCSKINSCLLKFLVCGADKVPESLLKIAKKRWEEKGYQAISNDDVKWRLLSGKISSPESSLLLSQALTVFNECFDPIIDLTNGRDLIPLMVHGKNSKVHDYGGMHCAVLIVNLKVVSAGLIRIFGQEVAELPLVATSKANHGKGYFQLLFSCIEALLAHVNVQSLVLPGDKETESIWANKFGFQKIKEEQLNKYKKNCFQLLTFEGTSMLHKTLPACRSGNRNNRFIL